MELVDSLSRLAEQNIFGLAFLTAYGLSALIGAIGPARPVPAEITQLSILIGTSQLLGLPLLIYLVVKHHYALVPFVFATITAIHFVLYAWLYQTSLYIVMAALIALGTATVMLTVPDAQTKAGPIRVCLLTGGLLLVTASAFLSIHLVAN